MHHINCKQTLSGLMWNEINYFLPGTDTEYFYYLFAAVYYQCVLRMCVY